MKKPLQIEMRHRRRKLTRAERQTPASPPAGMEWGFRAGFSNCIGFLGLFESGKANTTFSAAGDFIESKREIRKVSEKIIRQYWAKQAHVSEVSEIQAIIDSVNPPKFRRKR